MIQCGPQRCSCLLTLRACAIIRSIGFCMNEMILSGREDAVFEVIVELFLTTGQPVASREVAARKGQRLSSASIRSVMAHLEELGLLMRPHPSAGCTPTDRGLRYHIDRNIRNSRPSPALRRKVKDRFWQAGPVRVDDLGWVAGLAADLTREAGVALRPVGEDPILESLALVPLGGDMALGLIVTADRWVEKRVVHLKGQVRKIDLGALAADVTRRFSGQGVESVRERLCGEIPEMLGFSNEECQFLQEIFQDPGDGEVQVAGADNLFQNEAFSEVGRIRSVVRVLEDHPRLAGEWRRALRTAATRVFIGKESPLTAGGNLGMVATLFYRDGHTVGAVGIVGPRRMTYKNVIPVVKCIGETLSENLASRAAG